VDARDVIAVIGLALVAAGFWPIYPPLSAIVPGAVMIWYALFALRGLNDTNDHPDPHHQHDARN